MNIYDKDVYEQILKHSDDRTILNMLSVNKKFNDPKFFETAMKKRYPLLLRFRGNLDWKQFYIQTVYYLSKLEEIGVKYLPILDFDPKNCI